MAQVKTLAPYTVPSGAKVRLSEAQRKVRAHVPAAETEGGWLIFGGALTFKAGEVFELESVPKGAALEIPAETAAKEEPPAKTSGEAEGSDSKEQLPPKTSGETEGTDSKEEQPPKTSGETEGTDSKEEQPPKTSGAAVPVKPAKKAKP